MTTRASKRRRHHTLERGPRLHRFEAAAFTATLLIKPRFVHDRRPRATAATQSSSIVFLCSSAITHHSKQVFDAILRTLFIRLLTAQFLA